MMKMMSSMTKPKNSSTGNSSRRKGERKKKLMNYMNKNFRLNLTQ